MTAGHLVAERQGAIDAIESIQITAAWAFEKTPAESQSAMDVALKAVEESDIFVILVAGRHSAPVQVELDRALASRKPVLAFVSGAMEDLQSDDQRTVTDTIARHVKYQTFTSPQELRREVRAAIREELIHGYRRYRDKLNEQDIRTIIDMEPPGLVVRSAIDSDRPNIKARLLELKRWYPDIEPWTVKVIEEIGKTPHIRVAETEDKIAGLAITRDKGSGDVRKLATLYVTADSRGTAIGPHLVREEVKRAAADNVRKAYVTFAGEHRHRLKPVLEQSGFTDEGISPARYRVGAAEWVMGKTFEYDTISADEFSDFIERCIVNEHGGFIIQRHTDGFTASYPAGPSRNDFIDQKLRIGISTSATPEHDYEQFRQQQISTEWRFVSMAGKDANTNNALFESAHWVDGAELAAQFYPVQFATLGQESICVIIEPRYASELIPRSDQPSFLPPSRLQIRPDNVYYRHADRYDALRRGTKIFFYVSAPEQAIRGYASIFGYTVGTPKECFEKYGTRGILTYDDLVEAQDERGNVLAISFDWYSEFRHPVSLRDLRRIKPNFNPQTANRLSADESAQIMERGKDG